MGEIKAKITKVIYGNPTTDKGMFYILKISELDDTFTEENGVNPIALSYSGKVKTTTLTGNFQTTLAENQCIKFTATTVEYLNKKNGQLGYQLKLEKMLEFSYDEFNKETIMEYLKKSFTGMNNKIATAIIGKFGKKTMDNLGNVNALKTIPGLTEEKAKVIATQHLSNGEFITIMKALENIGIDGPISLTANLIQKYGAEDALNVLINEPYRIYEDGLCEFKVSESIATRRVNSKDIILGYDRMEYIRAIVLNVFEDLESAGHCCISDWNLYHIVRNRIKASLVSYSNILKDTDDKRSADEYANEEDVNKSRLIILAFKTLLEEGVLMKETFICDGKEEDFLYRKDVYDAEVFAAKQIMRLCHPDDAIVVEDADSMIADMEKEFNMNYHPCQKDAIKAPIGANFAIITGGPGTGKTTTLKAVINFQLKLNPNLVIFCAAPTGRASQRMAEATGYDAKTIHRLLEVDPTDGLSNFKHNQQNPLECDLLVIDEFSMVDIRLFGALMKAVTPRTKVICVGDSNQLPSVGPGSVLKDMIDSGKVPAVELKAVFRQDSSSLIAQNAHAIKENRINDIKQKPDGNFFCKFDHDTEKVKKYCLDLFRANLNKYQDIYQVQILTPVKKETYAMGAAALNPILRDIANPRADKKMEYRDSRGKCIFREGDKVMQRKNNYSKDVYNGDLGIIVKIDNTSKEIIVQFQFKTEIVTYDFSELGEVELAYATTIHKSQGSEYKCVICPISEDYNGQGFNSKNLLYTGLTRAKDIFYFVGDKDAIMFGLTNTETTNRCTTLRHRISGEKEVVDIGGENMLVANE